MNEQLQDYVARAKKLEEENKRLRTILDKISQKDEERDKNYKGLQPESTCLSQQYVNKKLKMFVPEG